MEVGSSNLPGTTSMNDTFVRNEKYGGLAQLARALAWHARGHRFDPDILHIVKEKRRQKVLLFYSFTFLPLQRSLTY